MRARAFREEESSGGHLVRDKYKMQMRAVVKRAARDESAREKVDEGEGEAGCKGARERQR